MQTITLKSNTKMSNLILEREAMLERIAFPAFVRNKAEQVYAKAQDALKKLGIEKDETKVMFKTFFKALKAKLGDNPAPTEQEVKEALAQLKDVGKLSVIIPIFMMPGGTTTLTIMTFLAKKLGYNLFPSAFYESLIAHNFRYQTEIENFEPVLTEEILRERLQSIAD